MHQESNCTTKEINEKCENCARGLSSQCSCSNSKCDSRSSGADRSSCSKRRIDTLKTSHVELRKIHIIIEHCLLCGLSKDETLHVLAELAMVDKRLSSLVWDKLKQFNPDYFEEYVVGKRSQTTQQMNLSCKRIQAEYISGE